VTEDRPEVADVFRVHGAAYLEAYGQSTSAEQKRVLRVLSDCRTAALGGHKKRCDVCGHKEFFYNSCRNRHCPKCQAAARAEWLEAQRADLLEVEYFHLVFTLPEALSPLFLQNRRALYGLLFSAASDTLLRIARDPKHLGAEIGFLMVLHTWGQNLHHHPHLHCVVPGGGISRDGSRWTPCRKGFFLPVRVLSRLFRRQFLRYLDAAFRAGKLSFHGRLEHLAEPDCWREFLRTLQDREWVVYSKPPFGGAEQVLKYLARYTHRVAISNQRLVSLEDGQVTFRWKDYAQGSRQRTMALPAVEFIRRFLQHVLPKGFVHIRHYGFLANRVRRVKILLCRRLLGQAETPASTSPDFTAEQGDLRAEKSPSECCPVCKTGRLVLVETIPPRSRTSEILSCPSVFDTS
jgi:hypothetical protein